MRVLHAFTRVVKAERTGKNITLSRSRDEVMMTLIPALFLIALSPASAISPQRD